MQFSLRFLLLILTVLALVFSFGAWVTSDYRRQERIRLSLRAIGANHVDVEVHRSQARIRSITIDSNTVTPKLSKYEHLDWSQICVDGEVNPKSLAPLAKLNNLHCVQFRDYEINARSDLKPLRNVKGLEMLFFSNCRIDAAAIGELQFFRNLRCVVFHSSQICPDAIKQLREALPNLRIRETDAMTGASM